LIDAHELHHLFSIYSSLELGVGASPSPLPPSPFLFSKCKVKDDLKLKILNPPRDKSPLMG
jgi:hypothetical protein